MTTLNDTSIQMLDCDSIICERKSIPTFPIVYNEWKNLSKSIDEIKTPHYWYNIVVSIVLAFIISLIQNIISQFRLLETSTNYKSLIISLIIVFLFIIVLCIFIVLICIDNSKYKMSKNHIQDRIREINETITVKEIQNEEIPI